MDADDLANEMYDRLRDEGFETLEEKQRAYQYKRAVWEYEQDYCNPNKY